MEEILASIRRIISEDSVHGKSAPAEPPRAAAAPSMRQAQATPAPVASPRAPLQEPVNVQDAEPEDDILDLGATYASVTRSPQPATPPAAPAWTMPLSPAPFFAAPQPVAKAPPAVPSPVAEVFSQPMAEPAPTLYTPPPLPQTLEEPEPAMAAAGTVPDAPTAFAIEGAAPDIAVPEIPSPESPAFGAENAPVAFATEIAAAPANEDSLASASEPIAGYIDMPAVELVPVETAPAGAEAPPVLVQVAEPALAPVSVVAQPVAGLPAAAIMTAPAFAEPAAPGKRTLEDAVADMLKPMLQDWLDKNMPRIIEKAMAKD